MACRLFVAKRSSNLSNQCMVIGHWSIQIFSFMKMHLKISSVKWRPFCPGGDESRFISLHDPTNPLLNVTFFVQNTLRDYSNIRQKGCHCADDSFKYIFMNENVWISIKISLKFVPKGSIDNIPALVQIMTWRRIGDTPLSQPDSQTHICSTRGGDELINMSKINQQATGLDAWASRVKCPARFVSHLHDICIYMSCS